MISRCVILVLISIGLYSCDPDPEGRRLPRHGGAYGEVLMVMPENQWRGAPGDSLRTELEAYIPQLPQAEARFSLLQFSTREMNDLLRQHRNIIQINIGPDYAATEGVKIARDQWSNHQLVFTINAEDIESYYDIIRDQLPRVVEIIDETELERNKRRLQSAHHSEIEKKISETFGVTILVPEDCEIAKTAEDFIWIKRERIRYIGNEGHQITQGFFIYTYPYVSDSAFTQAEILAVRDSVLKAHVPGPAPDTYMTTEYRYPPESDAKEINGRYAVITKGLWRTENQFMGGPFMSLTTTSADGSQIISISGFVFAPKFKKREYIREVEAVLHTLSFDEG